MTSVFQGPSFSRSRGREGEDPGNEVGLNVAKDSSCRGNLTPINMFVTKFLFHFTPKAAP